MLSLNNGLSALFPLILYPILVRQVGFELFGEYSIILTMCLFASVVTDYGFNITAVRKLTSAANKQEESGLFSLVSCVKLLILVGLAPIVGIIAWVLSGNISFYHLYAGAMAIIAGGMFNPIWYFLAKQKLHLIIFPNLISKLLAILLCVLLIKGVDDYWKLYYIIGGTSLAYGLFCFFIPVVGRSLHFVAVSSRSVIEEFRDGFSVFISNLSISFYTQVVFLILIVSTTKTIVGQYAIAERIVFLLRQVGGVFSQSFFVEMCELVQRKAGAMAATIKMQFRLFFSAICIFAIVIFIFSPSIIQLFTGEDSPLATNTLRILIWVPVIVSANIPFYQILLALNRKTDYNAILFLGCICGAAGGFVLCSYYHAIGAAVANVLVELLVTTLLMIRAGDKLPVKFFIGKSSGVNAGIL